MNNAEYLELKASYAALFPMLFEDFGLPAEKHPIAVLEAMEKTAPKQAAKGLEMAVSDLIEMAGDLPSEKVGDLDQYLTAAGLLTLSELRRRFSRKYAAILKRGEIRNEQEYQLVKNMRDGVVTEPSDVEQLAALMSDFEQKF